MSKVPTIGAMAFLASGTLALLAVTAFAHCDTTEGPIIPEAKAALEKGDVTPILKWVKEDKEGEVEAAFARAVAVRSKGPEARSLADQYFLENLVRLHRAGEGAPYTGIKDEPVAPVVAMADKALVEGSADAMIRRIGKHMEEAIRARFDKVLLAKRNKDKSVAEGREFVDAYISYTHYVEAVHAAITSPAGHHHGASAEASP